ncbi:MAG: integrase [Pseudonocardiaceae bacterium]
MLSTSFHHGLSVKVVQKRLGHATAQETLDTYGHLWPESDDDSRSAVADKFGAIINGAAPSPSEDRKSV